MLRRMMTYFMIWLGLLTSRLSTSRVWKLYRRGKQRWKKNTLLESKLPLSSTARSSNLKTRWQNKKRKMQSWPKNCMKKRWRLRKSKIWRPKNLSSRCKKKNNWDMLKLWKRRRLKLPLTLPRDSKTFALHKESKCMDQNQTQMREEESFQLWATLISRHASKLIQTQNTSSTLK